MSEYQYYDFRSIDKPLTAEQREVISSWSSRTEATSSGATFTYSFSNFSQDELAVVADYFDAMFYITNWGSRRLIFKIPKGLMDKEKVWQYRVEGLNIHDADDYLLIDFWQEIEDDDWVEGEGMLSGLISLRSDLMAGDYRSLYLYWLKICTDDLINEYDDYEEDTLEPEVPAGLNQLNGAMQEFAELFNIDQDMLAAAAQASPNQEETKINYSDLLVQLPEEEKAEWLQRLLTGEPLLAEKLRKRLSPVENQQRTDKKRTLRELVNAVVAQKNKREQAE